MKEFREFQRVQNPSKTPPSLSSSRHWVNTNHSPYPVSLNWRFLYYWTWSMTSLPRLPPLPKWRKDWAEPSKGRGRKGRLCHTQPFFSHPGIAGSVTEASDLTVSQIDRCCSLGIILQYFKKGLLLVWQ